MNQEKLQSAQIKQMVTFERKMNYTKVKTNQITKTQLLLKINMQCPLRPSIVREVHRPTRAQHSKILCAADR